MIEGERLIITTGASGSIPFYEHFATSRQISEESDIKFTRQTYDDQRLGEVSQPASKLARQLFQGTPEIVSTTIFSHSISVEITPDIAFDVFARIETNVIRALIESFEENPEDVEIVYGEGTEPPPAT